MESIDIKTIVYFVIAVLWLLFSSFKKSQKKARKELETEPPLGNKEIKEIVEDKTNARKFYEATRMTERVAKLKNKKKASKIPATITDDSFSLNNNREDDNHLFGVSDIDPRNMVIYSTIFKRPEY